MAAKLVFLGRLEDVAGCGEMAVKTGHLSQILAGMPAPLTIAILDVRIRMAFNGTILSEPGNLVLTDGDELAFLPPVSGG
jgi:sulfur-carrier protein